MKLFKAIRYDLRFGIYESSKRYLLIALFAAFVFVCLIFDMVHISVFLTGNVNGVWRLPISLGDVLLFELGGYLPISQNIGEGFSFPTIWFLSIIIPCYLTLSYTTRDLSGSGIQVITRLQSKGRWWVSKCILNATTIILYYAVIYIVIAALCLVFGFSLSFMPDETMFSAEFNAVFLASQTTNSQMFLALCLMPCITTVALSLVQMTMALFIKPAFAYIAICVYLAASVLCVYPFFITNFAMPVRSSAVGIYNFDFTSCLITAAAIALAAIVVGRFRILRMDILQGGKE